MPATTHKSSSTAANIQQPPHSYHQNSFSRYRFDAAAHYPQGVADYQFTSAPVNVIQQPIHIRIPLPSQQPMQQQRKEVVDERSHSHTNSSSCNCDSPNVSNAAPITIAMDPTDQRHILAERFKTKVCRNYVLHGVCPYESRCMFAHGDDDLRTAEMNIRDGLFTEEAIKGYKRAHKLMELQQAAANMPPPPSYDQSVVVVAEQQHHQSPTDSYAYGGVDGHSNAVAADQYFLGAGRQYTEDAYYHEEHADEEAYYADNVSECGSLAPAEDEEDAVPEQQEEYHGQQPHQQDHRPVVFRHNPYSLQTPFEAVNTKVVAAVDFDAGHAMP